MDMEYLSIYRKSSEYGNSSRNVMERQSHLQKYQEVVSSGVTFSVRHSLTHSLTGRISSEKVRHTTYNA